MDTDAKNVVLGANPSRVSCAKLLDVIQIVMDERIAKRSDAYCVPTERKYLDAGTKILEGAAYAEIQGIIHVLVVGCITVLVAQQPPIGAASTQLGPSTSLNCHHAWGTRRL